MTNYPLPITSLQETDSNKYQKVLKTLGLMETNLRHPSLNTHKYESLSGSNGEEIFEADVENKTPGAFRVFWYYGSEQGVITILAITPHP
ncbi:hypothetical protein CEN46_03740 [Fischerella thermalis CCMEE 5318]|uniref:Uncharacterized protein n=1 Tax=Fischerella thermalis CCMEE 5318 TaxID=2019666 RepID=A0A2N6LMH0_9CYAN|nr:hypothetical protein CEN46_03740 [Fischerella thermalis CCMEE 5318]